ncbi:MAG: electron transport complex subunit RsxG [Methylobacillus sp.]|jgi:electron transport complex protein RnfG|nr:electron transport complex subunit RsxG [Methylobacillus sp.]
MKESTFKHALGTSVVMIAFTIVGTVLLVSDFFATRGPIEENERQAKLELLQQVLPADLHDNELLKDTVKIAPGGDLGNRKETLAYRARLGGQPSALVLEATAPDGYSGEIKLLVGLKADGTIAGVRVIEHKETPGLGDYIDITHGNWIKIFDDESLEQTADKDWKVKKDGGKFDYVAGATITPRAVVKAVHKALKFYAAHRDEMFAEQEGEQ